MVAADGDAGRVNLRVARIGERRAFFVSAPGGGDVATFGVRREKEDVAVTAGGEHHGVAGVRSNFAAHQVARDDALGVAIDNDQIEHFDAWKHLHGAEANLAAKRLISAQQELLTGLAAGIKRARHLRAAEGTIVQIAAVFAGKRHALRDALVDDVHTHLRQTIDIGFARPEVAAFDRVVEKPVNAVTVVFVVLRGVNPALRGDAMSAAGTVLKAEAFYVVTKLSQRGCCGRARESGADDDDIELPLVRRVDQLQLELVLVPLLRQRSGGDFGVQFHIRQRSWKNSKCQIPNSKEASNSKLEKKSAKERAV